MGRSCGGDNEDWDNNDDDDDDDATTVGSNEGDSDDASIPNDERVRTTRIHSYRCCFKVGCGTTGIPHIFIIFTIRMILIIKINNVALVVVG